MYDLNVDSDDNLLTVKTQDKPIVKRDESAHQRIDNKKVAKIIGKCKPIRESPFKNTPVFRNERLNDVEKVEQRKLSVHVNKLTEYQLKSRTDSVNTDAVKDISKVGDYTSQDLDQIIEAQIAPKSP